MHVRSDVTFITFQHKDFKGEKMLNALQNAKMHFKMLTFSDVDHCKYFCLEAEPIAPPAPNPVVIPSY